MLLSKCPVCGSEELNEKIIDHEVQGGNNIAFIELKTEVCENCGEALFTEEQVRFFEQVREKLKNNQTDDFTPVGKSFRLAT